MAEPKSVIAICETNPVLLLLSQKNRHYPLEIIHRLFRDDYALEAPLDAFLRVCSAVREDLQMREGGGNYLTTPGKMLEIWCDGSRDAEPWFAMTDNAGHGKMVSLRPAARQAYATVITSDNDSDAMSGEQARAFFDNIASAAAHLRQDSTTTIARLKAEIEEREREIIKIETMGMGEVTEDQKENYGIELSRFVSELLTTMGKVPGRLRENVSQAREAFYELEGSHGGILRQVFEMVTEERRTRGYKMLETLNGIHYDARTKDILESALHTILEDCSDYIPSSTMQDARSLFRSLSDISLRIVSEDHHAVVQLSNFAESETFSRRKGQSRLLMELSETLRANAHHMRLRHRAPSEVPGFNIGAERHEDVKLHWFDLALSEAPPVEVNTVSHTHQPVSIDPEEAKREIEEATLMGAYLDTDRLKKWIGNIVAKNGPTPLSRILGHRALKYGIEEITAFTDVAMTMLPAEFREGWGMEIVIDSGHGDNSLAPKVGKVTLIRCADPVFLLEGNPGQMLNESKPIKPVIDKHSKVSEILQDAHYRHDGQAINVVRP